MHQTANNLRLCCEHPHPQPSCPGGTSRQNVEDSAQLSIHCDGEGFFHWYGGGIGTADQLAILAGAVYFYGHPALVFDARQGLATTYYGTGCDGGISCLGTLTGRPPFARDVIQHWLTEGYGTTNSSSNEFISPVAEIIFNTERCIICTSRDEEILMQLRPPDNIHTDVTPRAKAHGASSSSQYSVISSKHIIHYGIVFLIKRDLLHQCGGIASSSTSQPIDVMAGALSGESPSCSSVCYDLFSNTYSHLRKPIILKL